MYLVERCEKSIVKTLCTVLLVASSAFGIYAYKFHSLALESNKIFEYRCTNVNPHLISYKNSFLIFAECIKLGDVCSEEKVKESFDGYMTGMNDYVPEENKWLDMQRAYMDRWDFKLIEPWYIKQAGEYQWKMYEGYRDTANALVAIWKQGEMSDDANTIKIEAVQRRNDYEQKYYDFFDQAMVIKDWRKRFMDVPMPAGCTEENLTIPNTNGAFDEEPTQFPVDQDATS